jgi:hypothetical protein
MCMFKGETFYSLPLIRFKNKRFFRQTNHRDIRHMNSHPIQTMLGVHSTIVRFKPAAAASLLTQTTNFQPYNSTIQTLNWVILRYGHVFFQPYNSTIQTMVPCAFTVTMVPFQPYNSTIQTC